MHGISNCTGQHELRAAGDAAAAAPGCCLLVAIAWVGGHVGWAGQGCTVQYNTEHTCTRTS
jgi:hypothetical protein